MIDTQEAVIAYMRKNKQKAAWPNILLVFDDLAEDNVAMKSRAIQMLFLRGRHLACSVVVSVQKFRAINNAVRLSLIHI